MKGVVMKKVKFVLGVTLLASILLLTGCGKEQTLRCTATASGVDVGFNVKFKGRIITNMDITYDMDLSQYNDVQIEAIKKQDFCAVVKKSMSQYESAFENCRQEIANKKLHVASDLDVDKVTKNELEKLSSVDSAKEGLEKVGYTCTVE